MSDFISFYPGYKVKDVLDEYAITFFSLLAEGYKRRNREYLMQFQILNLHRAEELTRDQYLKQLEWASQDADDILNSEGDSDAIGKLKKIL